MSEDQVCQLIIDSLTEVNREKPADKRFEISPQTKLLSKGSAMDSLDYLNFSTCLEERIVGACGTEVDLSSLVVEHAESFQDVSQLARFLAPRLAQ